MKRPRFTEEQIIGVLGEQKVGITTAELCRRHRGNSVTFYKWKARHGGIDVSEAVSLKAIEVENMHLKRMLAVTCTAKVSQSAIALTATGNVWS